MGKQQSGNNQLTTGGRTLISTNFHLRNDCGRRGKESPVIKKNGTAYMLYAPNADGSSLEMVQDLRRTKPGTKPIGRALKRQDPQPTKVERTQPSDLPSIRAPPQKWCTPTDSPLSPLRQRRVRWPHAQQRFEDAAPCRHDAIEVVTASSAPAVAATAAANSAATASVCPSRDRRGH